MNPGESKELSWEGRFYTLTRILSGDGYTLWPDDKDRPYELTISSKGLRCSCPDFVYRGKTRPCKHIAMIRRTL